MDRAILEQITAARGAKRAIVLATHLPSGTQQLFDPWQAGQGALWEAAAKAARDDRSGTVEIEGAPWFFTVFNPPLRLILIGAVHIAQPLSRMAAMTDFDVLVIDPRTPFATAERFPGISLDTGWPDEAMAKAAPDARTAVVALTHDPKLDDPALTAALASPAFYVGALGSKKTHARRLDRLGAKGLAAEKLARIKGPVGLKIGAKSPAEIAISILGEMIGILRGEPA